MAISARSLTFVVAALLALSACSGANGTSTASSGPSVAANTSPDASAQESQTPAAAPTIIDVRTPEEFADGHLEGAINIDVTSADFATQVAALDPSGTYAVYCRSGNRSAKAAQFMADNNFANVTNLGSVEEAALALDLPIIQ